MLRTFFDLIIDAVKYIIELIKEINRKSIDIFLGLSLFEKSIVITIIPAIIAVIAPIASYKIFGSYNNVYNPSADKLVGIVGIMIITIFFPMLATMIIRVAVNVIYLLWMIYLAASSTIIKVPYELSYGFFFNILTPVLFMVFSILSQKNPSSR
jgi:hypothetical protein